MSVRAIYECRRIQSEHTMAAMLVSFGFETNLVDENDDPHGDAHEWAAATLPGETWDSIGEGPAGAVVDAWFDSEADALNAMVAFFENPPIHHSTGQTSPASR